MPPASLAGIGAVRSTWRGQWRYAVPGLAGWTRTTRHNNAQTEQRRPMPPQARYNTGYNVGVGGAVVDDGRLLLVRRASRRGRGKWQVLGGSIDSEEDM